MTRWRPRLGGSGWFVAAGLGLVLAAHPAARGASPTDSAEPVWTEEQRQHWSFVPPERPPLPRVEDPGWVRNPIDAFILSQLREFGLGPAAEADRATLLRRVTFDLTGLPPTPEEVEAFEADTRPDAYERLVDRLLASPRYGERWATPWLDLARFAESDGFKSDKTRPTAWRYRDWVVRALNDDMPYDRFVALQLAGDEIEPGRHDAFIATGFNRNWPFEDNNMVPGLNRQLILDDVTDTTAAVFLGLTVGCARCHDHKFDPISQKDYYRLQALFAAAAPRDDYELASPVERAFHATVMAEHRARVELVSRQMEEIERPYKENLLREKLAKLPEEVRKAYGTPPKERSAFQEDLLKQHAKVMAVTAKAVESSMAPEDRRLWSERARRRDRLEAEAPEGLPTASGMADEGGTPAPVHLLRKGNFHNPGEEVPPGFLSVFSGGPTPFEDRLADATSVRRKALAEWLTRPDHPLTARVMVNRLWQGHFGRGIVATPSDFGTQGAEPTHPDLLDWLATEFIARGWSQKSMHRLMVTSASYRQTSLASPESLEEDPDNLLFSRMSRRRLEGEAVRDSMLAASGTLDPRIGGPSVFPDLPPGMTTRGGWSRSESAADRNRRSLYVFVRRNLKYPLFDVFDAPDTNVTCPGRNVSVNAPQALMLLNSGLVVDMARALAGRVLADVGCADNANALVLRAHRLALGRTPTDEERERGVEFLIAQGALAFSEADAAKTKATALPDPMPERLDPAFGAALVDYCHALFNLNEFVFVD